MKEGELQILKEDEVQEHEIKVAVGEDISCMAWGSVSGFPLAGCLKGQFAVIEVKLEDGIVWKLKP